MEENNKKQQEQEQETLKGNIFIVPNMLGTLEGSCFAEKIAKQISMIVGREVSTTEVVAQIWVTCKVTKDQISEEEKNQEDYDPRNYSENWTDHGWPGEERWGIRFPMYLPAKELENLKEGETITFKSENGTIELTANQLDYRYRRFGDFQTVFKDRMEVYQAWEAGETIYIGGIPCSKNS